MLIKLEVLVYENTAIQGKIGQTTNFDMDFQKNDKKVELRKLVFPNGRFSREPALKFWKN